MSKVTLLKRPDGTWEYILESETDPVEILLQAAMRAITPTSEVEPSRVRQEAEKNGRHVKGGNPNFNRLGDKTQREMIGEALDAIGRPATAAEIYNKCVEFGFQSNSKNPKGVVASALNAEKKWFARVGTDQWVRATLGATSLFPEGKPKPRQASFITEAIEALGRPCTSAEVYDEALRLGYRPAGNNPKQVVRQRLNRDGYKRDAYGRWLPKGTS